jgi:urease accessory protein
MLQVSSIAGNIYDDAEIGKKFALSKEAGNYDVLELSRLDMAKSRMRKTTSKGIDVGIVLDSGTCLRHGDLLDAKTPILVSQIKEKVLMVTLKSNLDNKALFDTLVLVGHIIGNRHRPISILDGRICFPINNDAEEGTFRQLLGRIGGVNLEIEEMVFVPHGSMDVHEH